MAWASLARASRHSWTARSPPPSLNVQSLEPMAFTAPFIFTDFSFPFDGACKEEFDEEWK